MNAESLAVSASINIGLALLILTLFSVLRKQPSNAPIYYARLLSQHHHISFDNSFFGFRRLIPSVGWIRRALHVTEDDILDTCGLDVLIFIRLFKFGINFFLVCSVVGLLVLVPLNYIAGDGQPSRRSHSMDAFTISNIRKGSNWLWVHCSCLYFVSCYGLYLLYKRQANYMKRKIENLRHHSLTEKHIRNSPLSEALKNDAEIEELKEMLQELAERIKHTQRKEVLQEMELPVAFVTFKSRWGAALAAQSQQISNPLLWVTEMAPEPRDVLWRNLAIPCRYLPLYKFGVYASASLLTIFFAVPVTAVQGIAKFERLKKWFPPAMAVQLIPGLRSIVTGYLPSVILSGFIYVIPFAMIGMARLAGYISRSRKDIRACNMVFYFLVGNVFFLSLLSGSLLDQIGESFSHPRDIPGRLASAASAQADFFMTYILTNGLSGFSLEVLQPGLLIWDAMKSNTWDRGKKKQPYLYSLPYYRVIPSVALCILIGMVYAVVSPLLLPFLVGYFCLGYIVFINQSKPTASFATIPLLVFTILFNEYCKARFLSTFNHCSVKEAMDRDEYDEKTDLMQANLENAIDAYCPPCLRPLDLEDMESSRLQPLISPT
ncbi:UNVERIFIED_CONTAM: CSC1-like protein [Sesamum latifolium]|uniref:CSC1-like protein n=1 Tax=Sesamum latifolium TaxID=2727402 RepID=A0AAW2YFE2_9LAMI